jgi:hypothetical protein
MRLFSLAPLLLAACGPSYFARASECPAGYVPLETSGGEFKGRAMSAGGVVIGIRDRANAQEGSLEFWAEVVRKDLTEGQGYSLKASRDLRSGRALLFAAPREKTTDYYVALFVTPSRVTTVEVAGPRAEVEKDLPLLEESIRKLGLE